MIPAPTPAPAAPAEPVTEGQFQSKLGVRKTLVDSDSELLRLLVRRDGVCVVVEPASSGSAGAVVYRLCEFMEMDEDRLFRSSESLRGNDEKDECRDVVDVGGGGGVEGGVDWRMTNRQGGRQAGQEGDTHKVGGLG